MQLHGATKIELDLLEVLRDNEAGPAGVESTKRSAAMSNAIEELQRLRTQVSEFCLGDVPNRRNFDDELVCLLNKYSKENASNTPDFILAGYLKSCLLAWNEATKDRETWYGREFKPGSISK